MSPAWLLLIHQIPPDPSYLRVKVRRRLRRIGAVAVKNTVYALPAGDEAREGFEWLAREIRAGSGEAIICQAHFVSGLSDEDVRNLFRAEREEEYMEIAASLEGASLEGTDGLAARIAQARRRLAAAVKLDFFSARGRATAERAIADAEARLDPGSEAPREGVRDPLDALRGRVWVTRRGVHVDRMASAWLIRRFIDPDARFRFVDPNDYQHAPGELRFDMYEAEYTHEGDLCTFEVLGALAAPDDQALRAIAEIVHEIDLEDGKFDRAETAGVDRMVTGIQASCPGDHERVERAAELFEGLYRAFGGAGPVPPA